MTAVSKRPSGVFVRQKMSTAPATAAVTDTMYSRESFAEMILRGACTLKSNVSPTAKWVPPKARAMRWSWSNSTSVFVPVVSEIANVPVV